MRASRPPNSPHMPFAPRRASRAFGCAFVIVSFMALSPSLPTVVCTSCTARTPWFPASELWAQSPVGGAVIGIVRDAAGVPLGDATVRVTRGTSTHIFTTGNNGRYRFGGLVDGVWALSAQRIGFTPFVTEVSVNADGIARDIVLTATTRTIDSVLVSARWTGVRGIVYDARRFVPLERAEATVMGSRRADSSNADGTFAIELPRGQTALVRVERAGFLPVMRSVAVEDGRYVELDIPLDTANPAPKNLMDVEDLERRLRMAGAFAVMIGREELQKTGAKSVLDAMIETPSGRRKNLVIGRDACVFVNGRARPGFPIDAVWVEDVEFIEVYPGGSELSNTLARRWPPGAPCGVPSFTPQRGQTSKGRARVVSVWLKNR